MKKPSGSHLVKSITSDHEETKWLRNKLHKYLYSLEFQEAFSPHTLRAYRVDLAQAFEIEQVTLLVNFQGVPEVNQGRAGSTSPTPLTPDQESFLFEQTKKAQRKWSTLAPASKNRKTATLKSFLGWLHREDYLTKDISSRLHSPKVPQRLPRHLSVDEAIVLIRTAEAGATTEDGLKRLALLALLYGGGLRVSEACALESKNVDFHKLTCLVRGKGAKERVIALPALALAAVKALDLSQRYVFGSQPLSTRVAYDWVRDAGVAAKLVMPLHPHALRHSYATHLLLSGANLRTLQALLGHTTLQATSRYTHVGLDQLARTLEAHHPFSKNSGKKPDREA